MASNEDKDLLSSLQVVGVGKEYIGSSIKVSSNNEMFTMVDIIGSNKSEIVGSILVTSTGTDILYSVLSVSTDNKVFVKTDIETPPRYDIKSSMYVGSYGSIIPASLAVKDKNKMTGQTEISVARNNDINSSIQVEPLKTPDLYEISATIGINDRSKMTGQYELDSFRAKAIPSSLEVQPLNALPSSLHIGRGNIMYGRMRTLLVDNSELEGTVGVTHSSNIDATIVIKGNNIMYGITEVDEQPKESVKINPIKDAFLSEKVPTLNYGGEQTLVVGLGEKRYRTILGFNSTAIPEKNEVDSADLRLYITAGREPNRKLQLYAASDVWTEYGVTWANQPERFALITDEHTNHNGSITFDLTDFIVQHHASGNKNFSFYVVAEDETEKMYDSFFSRESTQKPVLEVIHHGINVPNTSRANLDSSITVRGLTTKDIPTKIQVLPPLDTLSTEAEGITLHAWDIDVEDGEKVNVYLQTPDGTVRLIKKDWVLRAAGGVSRKDFLDLDLDMGLNVIIYEGISAGTHGDLVSNMRLLVYGSRNRNSGVPPMLTITKQGKWVPLKSNEFGTTIKRDPKNMVGNDFKEPKPTITWRVIRRPISDIEGTITVDRRKSLVSSILVGRPNLPSTISIKVWEHYDIPSTLGIRGRDVSDLGGQIIVNQPDLPSTINILGKSVIDSSLEVVRLVKEDLPSSITISKAVIVSTIRVTHRGNDDLESSIQVERPFIKVNLPSILRVNVPDIPSKVSIRRRENSDLEGKVAVLSALQDNDMISTIKINEFFERNDVPSNIEVIPVYTSSLPSQIQILDFNTSGSKSIPSSIEVWHKSNLGCSIRIISGNLQSSIGVKGYDHHEIFSTLWVSIRAKDDIDSTIDVATVRSYLPSSIEITEDNRMFVRIDDITEGKGAQLPSEIRIKLPSNLPSMLGVRDKNHMEGIVAIDINGASNILSFITIKQVSELPCEVNVKVIDEIPCSIDIETDYGYYFIM